MKMFKITRLKLIRALFAFLSLLITKSSNGEQIKTTSHYTTASAGNLIWLDVDGDGLQDAGEPGVGGVFVVLADQNGTGIVSTLTDSSGNYSFNNIDAGTTGKNFKIWFKLPAGYKFSPSSGFIADRLNSDANVVTGMTELFTLLPGQQNTDIDAGIISVSISTLPLHRFQLTGRLSGRNVTLKWVAENELGTENFVIERSVNGTTYDAIALMQPTGPLNVPTEYFHSDENLGLSLDNIIYYRIKAMDREGRFAYSNVVIIRANKNVDIKIWPNPVTDFVNITYIAPATTTIDVSILNSLGKTVRQSGYAVSRGLNQVSVNDLKDLSSGIYFIRIANKNANEVYVQKISK